MNTLEVPAGVLESSEIEFNKENLNSAFMSLVDNMIEKLKLIKIFNGEQEKEENDEQRLQHSSTSLSLENSLFLKKSVGDKSIKRRRVFNDFDSNFDYDSSSDNEEIKRKKNESIPMMNNVLGTHIMKHYETNYQIQKLTTSFQSNYKKKVEVPNCEQLYQDNYFVIKKTFELEELVTEVLKHHKWR